MGNTNANSRSDGFHGSADPGLMSLLGWPWTLAAVMLAVALGALALAVAPGMGLGAVAGVALPRVPFSAVAALAIPAAILALLSFPLALRRIAGEESGAPERDGSAVPERHEDRDDVVAAIRELLNAERGRVQTAATTMHGIASMSIQLAEAVRDAERRLRALPDQMPVSDLRDAASTLRAGMEQVEARLGNAAEAADRQARQLGDSHDAAARLVAELGTQSERMQVAAGGAELAMAKIAAACEAAGNGFSDATRALDGAAARLHETAGRTDGAAARIMEHLESLAAAYAVAVADLAKVRDGFEEANGRTGIVLEATAARLAGRSAQDAETAKRIEADTQALSAIVTRLGEEILRMGSMAERHDAIIRQAAARLSETGQDGNPATGPDEMRS